MTDFLSQFDHTRLDKDLIAMGKAGGSLGYGGYKQLVNYGHSASLLNEAIDKATRKGLALGPKLNEFLMTGIDPDQRAAELAALQNQSSAIRDQTATQLRIADQQARDLENERIMNQRAAAERMRAEEEARRMQMARDRSAKLAANLQIAGQPGFRGRGGSAGFRRRSDQFQIDPSFKGLSAPGGATKKTNKLVNL